MAEQCRQRQPTAGAHTKLVHPLRLDRVLHRRAAREKLAVVQRRPFQSDQRHKVASARPRKGGRFLAGAGAAKQGSLGGEAAQAAAAAGEAPGGEEAAAGGEEAGAGEAAQPAGEAGGFLEFGGEALM